MEERLLHNVSFAMVCKMLKSKTSLWNDIVPILQGVLTLVPALVSFETISLDSLPNLLGVGVTLGDTTSAIEKAISSLRQLFNKTDEGYITRAENAQIANVLLVFTAYFDTVKTLLPDSNRNIFIGNTQYHLTEESLKKHQQKLIENKNKEINQDGRKIANWEFNLPNILQGLDDYELNLKEFYNLLNDNLWDYLKDLSYVEEMREHRLDEVRGILDQIPQIASRNYRHQYHILAAECPDFFVFSNQQEHAWQRTQIDRGFKALSSQLAETYEQLRNIPKAITNHQANTTLSILQNHYLSVVKKHIISTDDMPLQDQKIVFPIQEDIFIPPAYEWLIYENKISLAVTKQWKNGNEIGADILNSLLHPELCAKPLVILGDPGAGKTTLCHMLAGKLLFRVFHVIIMYLRDLDANLTIADQISRQIKLTTDNGECEWHHIATANLDKPILLIFDGYDELLQASGQVHNDYLNKIAEFQEKQWRLHGIIVRSIVTSRSVLIDKVDIPIGSIVLRLKPFDETRIDAWCKIWNYKNQDYFLSNNLSDFQIGVKSEAARLAGEPLLLLMLALYDTNGNALRKHQNLKATQLYDSLISDFVKREKKKDSRFNRQDDSKQSKEIQKEIEQISIAALGMFNRNELHITSEQLEKDLKLLSFITSESELKESEKLLGSFFFIHKETAISSSTTGHSSLKAYTFLHNTFGEYLTAYYITLRLYNIIASIEGSIPQSGDISFLENEREKWYMCISFAPLFQRPVIGKMLSEWARQYFHEKRLDNIALASALQVFFNQEIIKVLQGKIIVDLNPIVDNFHINENNGQKRKELNMIDHIAIYAINLVSLVALILDEVSLIQVDETIPNAWEKLLHLWRCSFDEDDIAAFAGQYELRLPQKTLVSLKQEVDLQSESNRANKLYRSYKNLHEEPAASILGALLGSDTEYICSSLQQQNLKVNARSILLGIALNESLQSKTVFFPTDKHNSLSKFLNLCIEEQDYASMYNLILMLNDIASDTKGRQHLASRVQSFPITNIYTISKKHFPAIIAPLLEFVSKLLPMLPDEEAGEIIRQINAANPFKSQLGDRELELWVRLLWILLPRSTNKTSFPNLYPYVGLLLERAKDWYNATPDLYSCETIELLCEVFFEISKKSSVSIRSNIAYDYINNFIKSYCNSENNRLSYSISNNLSLVSMTLLYAENELKNISAEHMNESSEKRKELQMARVKQTKKALSLLVQYMYDSHKDFSELFEEKPCIALAVCYTLVDYSEEVRMYVLSELTDFLTKTSGDLSLKLYRELTIIAKQYSFQALQKALLRFQ